jgi:hypothetical protein
MKPINNLVHYIWVGSDPIPESYKANVNRAMSINPDYTFKIWTESEIIPILNEYATQYQHSTIFHKLQIARYIILDKFGGLYSDLDIWWKIKFDTVYGIIADDCELVFPKRNSLYFYNRGQKTDLIDDFVIIAKPGKTKKFLKYCEQNQGKRDSKNPKTDPYSVYALTEWLFTEDKKAFLNHKLISSAPESLFAVHVNKTTWDAK